MGIRYYAYPLNPRFTTFALGDPEPFLSEDPFAAVWSSVEERPDMLYLDKSWPSLQALTNPARTSPRPAHQLFEGQVTYTDGGNEWYAWRKALSPETVESVAADLALLGEAEVDEMLSDRPTGFRDPREQRSYILEFLGRAQEFSARMRDRHWGIVYSIQ